MKVTASQLQPSKVPGLLIPKGKTPQRNHLSFANAVYLLHPTKTRGTGNLFDVVCNGVGHKKWRKKRRLKLQRQTDCPVQQCNYMRAQFGNPYAFILLAHIPFAHY